MVVPQVDLQVNLSEQAVEYIKEYGGIFTLEEAPQTGCCSNVIFVGAHTGKPKEEGYFGVKKQDGIQIYYDPFVIKKDKHYEVVLEGLLRWKTLRVY
ncbi:MAG TPA: CC/Se motif family (seleno)protein [Desulfosporosinus sp.]|nr:CC/Se motif family (seleno)protein [Desulfosporosinus sp.]